MFYCVLQVLSFVLLYVSDNIAGEDYEDYVYDYSTLTLYNKTDEGKRLINARASEVNENPFVGAFFLISKHLCTSSLISPQYALRSLLIIF